MALPGPTVTVGGGSGGDGGDGGGGGGLMAKGNGGILARREGISAERCRPRCTGCPCNIFDTQSAAQSEPAANPGMLLVPEPLSSPIGLAETAPHDVDASSHGGEADAEAAAIGGVLAHLDAFA
ncbi:uncharacterized protein CIMG_12885 [Coccidioides immitis RS]|uniref:Uncharacterized protein n=1 Tax=Coccidioides immitis (strain RS) TaxID=246410 RepID=A0A0D8JSS2_COCIM|nr:uncharacterized protein CIMG_12885 [Coccidioides immitis RS]KJF60337.1 hypothetical protein CIMG_12885 [Coccidioides immitis RS]